MAKLRRGKGGGWKENFWVDKIVVGIVVGVIVLLLFTAYTEHIDHNRIQSQIDSSLQKADSRRDSGQYEEAIKLYEEIINTISSKEFPYEYARIQNNMGIAYRNLALANNKENNLNNAIQAYEEALKIYTVEGYPVDYAMTQNNLGTAYRTLAEVRDKEENLKRAIEAYEQALNIYTEKDYPLMNQIVKSNLELAQSQLQH